MLSNIEKIEKKEIIVILKTNRVSILLIVFYGLCLEILRYNPINLKRVKEVTY